MRTAILTSFILSANALDNGRSVTPPMGWVRPFFMLTQKL